MQKNFSWKTSIKMNNSSTKLEEPHCQQWEEGSFIITKSHKNKCTHFWVTTWLLFTPRLSTSLSTRTVASDSIYIICSLFAGLIILFCDKQNVWHLWRRLAFLWNGHLKSRNKKGTAHFRLPTYSQHNNRFSLLNSIEQNFTITNSN